ncbi:MAG: hypothetical protein HDT29_05180, partial [Clostridiales bacterium]|nr:hypothetical protein [Clostridiales bacterium]
VTGGDGQDPSDPENPAPGSGFDFSKVLDTIKNNWQPILSILSILLTIIFMSKGIGYAGKRKKAKKTIEKRYTAYYVISGVGLFGLPNTTWTVIACILAGVAVLAFIFMLLQKRALSKALEEMEDAKEEYTRNREEANYMRMTGAINGGMGMAGQAGVVYTQQPQFAIEDMRGMINEAMSNMLPTVTQYLPQQASMNDELVQQLVEQNAQNEEKIRQLTEQNQEVIRGQEILMQRLAEQSQKAVDEDVIEKLAVKLAKQQAIEQEAEKEVASAVVNEKTIEELKETIREEIHSQMTANAEKAEKDENAEIIRKLVEGQELLMKKLSEQSEDKSSGRVEVDRDSDKFEMLMRNQEMLMKQIVVLTANKNNGTQIIKEVDRRDDNADIIKSLIEHQKTIMEKLVEKPTDKVVLPIMQQPIVQQPAEKVVERIVEKPVPMPVEKPAKATKTPAPRLTLDEAYAKLSATQKKIFDALKNYAMSKDKCKEKKSTYFTVLGQSTVNPLVKLTIKKNTTVALFKMEDEYFKDIRKNAGSDGTKVKVKESEIVVSDNQALSTAKEMIDLREDQIERYNEYLKEQKSMRKK